MSAGGKASSGLWTIGMNDLLKKLDQNKGLVPCAFADDLAALTSGSTIKEIQTKVEELIRAVGEWCKQAEFKLNVGKTEIINPTKKKKNAADLRVTINNEQVKFKEHLKYLGLVIYYKMNFKHLRTKTTVLIQAVRKLM